MAEQITIPISIFELTIRYEKPVFRLLTSDPADVIQALFEAFAEYRPNPDDLEVVSTGKTTEKGIKLRLASEGINLFVGATNCKFTKEAAVWPDADKIFSIVATFLETLTEVGGILADDRKSVLSLHLQPKTVPFQDLLRPFIRPEIQNLESAPLRTVAIVAVWPGRRVTVDGSALLANGIFVQMERDFAASVNFVEMRRSIAEDEVAILKLIGVEEVTE